jgi:hypothetical protein
VVAAASVAEQRFDAVQQLLLPLRNCETINYRIRRSNDSGNPS